MTAEMGCEQVRDLAPELALGIAEGEERDAALRHLSGCSGCRQLVSELSLVGDELLQLAPAHDPPVGFESRVLTEVTKPPRRRTIQPLARRWQWLATAAAAVVLAAPLQGAQGRVGTVFGYQGQPSWVMVTLQPPTRDEDRFQVQAVTRDGRYLPLGDAVLGGAKGTWGGQLPVDLSAVRELRFVGSDGRPTLTATFDTTNPWD